jgi:DNA-binding NtrC family response regulator
MRKQPAIETNSAEAATVLSVSPAEEDHALLECIFSHSKWKLRKAHSLASAIVFLQGQSTSVVLCETDLLPGTWRDLLAQTTRLSYAPTVIVSSRLADDRLWAEALNLGAWDVLAKPFSRSEVLQAVSAGWRHWKNQQEGAGFVTKLMKAAV